ncbi:MAG TPA: hypothetical protein VF648_17520, partial [Pyrinomonadaceae bacterium]
IIQKYLLPSSNQPERAAPVIGKQMNLSDVNWAGQPKTLVLALSTSCHFCNESAPFYRRLLEETKGKNIRFIAVFSTKTEDSIKHLEKLGINGFEVKQAPISALDASGTPTLILTNDKGEVTNFWIGRLPANKESEVINQLNS